MRVFWFRRDLRLEDNHGLYMALKNGEPVIPLFIFDANILSALEDTHDARLTFIWQQLQAMDQALRDVGSSLLVKHGSPLEVWKALLEEHQVSAVYFNHDYEPYARKRDQDIAKMLIEKEIVCKSYKDQVMFEKSEILTQQGNPYTVYTPYSKSWKSALEGIPRYPSEDLKAHFWKAKPQFFPSLADLGFVESSLSFPSKKPSPKILKSYADERDIPHLDHTTHLGVHLRFGTVSIRKMVDLAQDYPTWLNELIWREFFMQILWHYPHVVTGPFREKYKAIQWRNAPQDFEAWCQGQTGYALVDAGMRELNQTGFMHNRVRMLVASFLTKHLLIDWRKGERYFAQKLLDYDLSANNGNWQWAAGTGCDAAPYFRIFNPMTQLKKFDPDLKYVKKWVPEYGTSDYPEPIVDHKAGRERALAAYKSALGK